MKGESEGDRQCILNCKLYVGENMWDMHSKVWLRSNGGELGHFAVFTS